MPDRKLDSKTWTARERIGSGAIRAVLGSSFAIAGARIALDSFMKINDFDEILPKFIFVRSSIALVAVVFGGEVAAAGIKRLAIGYAEYSEALRTKSAQEALQNKTKTPILPTRSE